MGVTLTETPKIKMSLSNLKSCKPTLPDRERAKNMASVFLFYIAMYLSLAGFYALMLRGVIDTSRAGGRHTLLWTFFFSGIVFAFVVSSVVFVSQYEEKQKREDDFREPRRSYLVGLEGSPRRDVLQCV